MILACLFSKKKMQVEKTKKIFFILHTIRIDLAFTYFHLQ